MKKDSRRPSTKKAAGPPLVCSFPPISAPDAELLILGTVPSKASMAAERYYAHPQNAFWPILGEIVGFPPTASYEEKKQAVKAARIAIWDVLASCEREGSLDSAIVLASEVPNDFAAFFATHRRIRRVVCNGGISAALYRRHVLAKGLGADLEMQQLPSTSPANATWSRARKLEAWREALRAGAALASTGAAVRGRARRKGDAS